MGRKKTPTKISLNMINRKATQHFILLRGVIGDIIEIKWLSFEQRGPCARFKIAIRSMTDVSFGRD